MNPLMLWRSLAILAALGWACTATGWAVSTTGVVGAEPQPGPAPSVASSTPAPGPASTSPRSEPRPARGAKVLVPSGGSPDLAELRTEVRNQVIEEMEAERQAHHEQRGQAHLQRLRGVVSDFVDDNGLDAETRDSLDASASTLHESLEALRPDGPPEPGGPPAEVMAEIRRVFDQFRDEVDEAIGDPGLADAFVEQMTPRPIRDFGEG